jgi:hypothetical protein
LSSIEDVIVKCIRIGKAWPVLALGFAMAMPGAAIAHSIILADGAPPVGVTLNRPEADPQQSVLRGPIAALLYEESVADGTLSRMTTAEILQAPSGGIAKTYALMLSSLGMLGMISSHRLTRTLSVRPTK